MVLAILLFVRERDGWGAVVLAAAVWTKFFPIVFLPLVLMDRLVHRGGMATVHIVVLFLLASAAINVPVLLLTPEGWWYFFAFNAERGGDLNLYTLFFDADRDTPELMNRVGILLTLCGLILLLLIQLRMPQGAWLPACAAMLAWFFFVGKVYSPQYSLWIVVLLAVVGASTALAVAWSSMDVVYFGASFVTLGLGQYGEAQGWFVGHILEPAAILREGMLLIVAAGCVYLMSAPTQNTVRVLENEGMPET